MPFRDNAHAFQVYNTPEYRRMVSEYIQQGAPVPLSVFQANYANAFFGNRGRGISPDTSERSRQAFVNLMRWTGRAPSEVETWDDWIEFNGYD